MKPGRHYYRDNETPDDRLVIDSTVERRYQEIHGSRPWASTDYRFRIVGF